MIKMKLNISISASFYYRVIKATRDFKVKDKQGNELQIKKGEKVKFFSRGEKTYLKDLKEDDLVFSIKKSDFDKYFTEDTKPSKKESKVLIEKKNVSSKKEAKKDSKNVYSEVYDVGDTSSVKELKTASQHSNASIRASAARNENAPPSVLRKLSTDAAADVKSAVAENPNTESDVLDSMAKENNDSSIRAGIASNKNTSTNTLSYLVKDIDQNSHIWINVAANRNASSDTLQHIIKNTQSSKNINLLYRAVERNPNVNKETLNLIKLKRKQEVK